MGSPLSPDGIDTLWMRFASDVDRMMERAEDPDSFMVTQGSSLAGDDQASEPYQVSHAVQLCIAAGTDHLHAVKTLVVDHHLLHGAAPFTLVRGALEIFSSAFWILHPSRRNTRIERVLRWHAKNFHDQHPALASVQMSDLDMKNGKYSRLREIANRRGLGVEVAGGYRSTEAVTYADTNCVTSAALFAWQICSGYAHGRPWAYFGMADEEAFEGTGDPGVVRARLTSEPWKLLYPSLQAQNLMNDLVDLATQRASQQY